MGKNVLVIASPEQLAVAVERHSIEWSNGVSSEQYAVREKLLGRTGLGKGITCYVLVPDNDTATLDPFCSCEVYRRSILISSSTVPITVYRDVAYSIASVFTPMQHRRNGYCRTMMNLLHAQLERPFTEEGNKDREVAVQRTRGKDAILSFLYSDIGDFYKRSNWHISNPVETVWTLSSLPTPLPTLASMPSSLRLLSVSDLPALAAVDAAFLREEVKLEASRTGRRTIAVEPTGKEYEWLDARVRFYAERLPVPRKIEYYGAEVGERGGKDWGFLVWSIEYSKKTLKILRIRCADRLEGDTIFSTLLDFAIASAVEHGLEKVVAWVVRPEWLAALPESRRGSTSERTDSLSALSMYGTEEERKVTRCGEELGWIANEAYAWC